MAGSHKVMILLDTAGGAARQSPARRAALRLLTYLSCRFGLARVHWAFKFFDSLGARIRPSRVSDFRELGARSWDDFEEELEARLEDLAHGAHLPGPAPRATHTHSALMETLLDYQWDRPEITSPTKPFLRSRGRRLLGEESEAQEAEGALGGLANAVFLLAPCPRSRRELLQFLLGCQAQAQSPPPTPKQVMEKLLSRIVQEAMIARKITLYWVDTTEWAELWESPDHVGFQTVCELLHHVGGTVLPSEMFSQDIPEDGQTLLSRERKRSSPPHRSSWISALPTDSTLNCLLYNAREYEASFPWVEGTLFLPVKGKEIQEACTVTLEPLTMNQNHFQKPVRIVLKGTAAHWTLPVSGTLGTDSWMLRSPEQDRSNHKLFQQLTSRLTAEELHLVASVDPGEGWPPVTGVISPLSASAAVLTVLLSEDAEFQRHYLQRGMAESSQDTTSLLSYIENDVMKQIHNPLEEPAVPAPVPEWTQQELGCTAPWSAAVVEKWFPFSNLNGASSNLMESFWLLQAASAQKDESCKTEHEVTCCLSEFYQRKSREESAAVGQGDSRRKRGLPRTPVRQKMNTMCRSLKMLNVARLNVKAQKLQPDGSPDGAQEKGIQKTAGGRTAEKSEDKGRTLRSSKAKDFKTEEELLSYIHENYQKTVATGEIPLYSCAQNLISTFKAFLKSQGTKELEMNCLKQIKDNLLKTSKGLRQNLGKILNKEVKVRECQLQVFLRLELCLQCPLIQESADDMEQIVEEVAGLLRIVSLTEDSAYLAAFLEEILGLYTDSVPTTLGALYDSLGFQIPQKLASALPSDFFSDDSMTQESKSPGRSVPRLPSTRQSVPPTGGADSNQLEELRTRSAKKRRKNALIRHKSIAEGSQNLRQIEVPKVSKRAAKNNSHCTLQQPPLSVKETVQEVTKVRRNLFNREMLSPSKKSLKRGFLRSHSLSAVDGLEYKPDNFKRTKEYHKLLTKSVAETPEHKQISKRLLHKQIKGRSSDPGPDIDIVEESPEKEESELNLRRSPRIKQLLAKKTHSCSFYSASHPKSRSVQRVHSFQHDKSGQRENSPVQSIRSPKRLLFGAVSEMTSPSGKVSAQSTRPSRNTDSKLPTAYQTPKKNSWKSPRSSTATPGRPPRTPQAPSYPPERLLGPPAEVTPEKQAAFQEPLKDPSSSGCDSPSELTVTPQKGFLLAQGLTCPPRKKMPRTPTGHAAQPAKSLQTGTWSQSVPPSPAPTVQTRRGVLVPVEHCLKKPLKPAALGLPGETALVDIHRNRQSQAPQVPGTFQGTEQVQTPRETLVKARARAESPPVLSSSPLSPEEPVSSPSGDVSGKSPSRESLVDSPPARELDWEVPQKSPDVLSTPPHNSHMHQPDTLAPPPPSKIAKRNRKSSNPVGRRFPGPQRNASGSPVGSITGGQKEGSFSPRFSPESHGDPRAGLGRDWHFSSPLLISSDTDYLTLREEAPHNRDHMGKSISPEQGQVLQTAVCDEQAPLSHQGIPPSPPASGSSSPLLPSCGLSHSAGEKQGQEAAHREPQNASTSPKTYEVELEMQASGLPKLRIKKVEAGSCLDAEPPLRKDCWLGEESAFPELGSWGSRPSAKPDSSYMSPPCLRSSHSTPGKSGGQIYICQAWTPTRCPSSTPSPFQAEVGVPWTPSPKHNGKTPPDTIKDWPRRKRAMDCSAGGGGKGEASSDLPGIRAAEQEEMERRPERPLSKIQILADFELEEGVCQLPDQSPPRDSIPMTEDAFSRAQFGWGSLRRCLSAKEEAEGWAQSTHCDSQREDGEGSSGERSLCAGGGQLPSMGEGAFVSGSTPPSGFVVRGCLSASGLQALTQSPLLFQGRTPSQHTDTRDEDLDGFASNAEESPFSRAFSRRRPISRTYTRKKLIS
ncbi:treslin [Echinops telfairi]|uniref:Treslin n=1 Tax=Echinops telfairi TaxID=9371 RepID=A0AC55DKZ4_ECHTE|nr:treslin [Echinops telfairi]